MSPTAQDSLPPFKTDIAVLILFFNRPDHLARLFEAIREARPSRLLLYQDGPRSEADLPRMEACRKIVEHIDWQCEVHRCYQEKNSGCDPSNYLSHRWAFSIADKCIIFEDDDIPSQSFFPFCKEMLDRYEHDERIVMISGFNVDEVTPDVPDSYFFTSTFSIWGWASWRRVIDRWEGDYAFLDDEYAMRQLRALVKQRDYRSDFFQMCQHHRESGKEYYESIFWGSNMLQSGLAIVPAKNMISNMGLTDDSTHFSGNLKTTPRGFRRIFTMGRYEMDFPLRHPKYVIDHVAYKERFYKTYAWNHPWTKVCRSVEELFLNLRYGNFRHIGQAMKNRFMKMTGRKKHG